MTIVSIMSIYSPWCESYLHVAILSHPQPDPRTVKAVQQSEGCGLDEAGKDSLTCFTVIGMGCPITRLHGAQEGSPGG